MRIKISWSVAPSRWHTFLNTLTHTPTNKHLTHTHTRTHTHMYILISLLKESEMVPETLKREDQVKTRFPKIE